MSTSPGAPYQPAHTVRRNFWLGVIDGSLFNLGVSVVSRFTVLPLIVERLSDARWLQGLIPAIYYAGWLLPALFVAPTVAARERRKPWLLAFGLGERLPYLALGLVAILAPGLPPEALLGVLLGLFTVFSFSQGLNSIAWQDFVARIVPERRWGTFIGLNIGLGGVLGVGGAAIAGLVLAGLPFPQSAGVLALICFACMMLSYLFLALIDEAPRPALPPQSIQSFLRGLGPLLRQDVIFRRYLICRGAISLGLVGHSFITAAALERFRPPDAEVALYTAALLGFQALGNVGLGALADRWGHKRVLVLSTGIGVAALLLAVVAPASSWFIPIFALVGASQAGFLLSGYTLVFAFSPPEDRPRYIGVANTALAPVAALSPLLVGWLTGVTGYGLVFALLALIGAGGAAALHWRVPASGAQPQASGGAQQ